ncbi:hypothetical protein [Reyranella sp.]|jgi:hypothetical protein|uniref:hypothetical protein n=1 Tax=Reyranella sp. TaxID=1929291 RepID=UPI0026129538|nr:hypothetical protein [Reyranella sp.]HQT15760.1 hypothetical protein [Reyranella sp.]
MAPADDVGRVSVVDLGRESASRLLVDEGERRPDQRQAIGERLRRALKRNIVAAGQSGAISQKRARALIARFDLRNI